MDELSDRHAPTIMIVDDKPDNLKLLQNLLVEQGHKVMAFPRGEQALHAAARHKPDLILLDIRMPEMDGYEVCRRLKADISLQDIPVLFISALNSTQDKLQAFAHGGVDYVTKPFQPEEVRARVNTHLQLRRLLRESEERNQVLIEELPDVVMRFDDQLRYTFVSEKVRDIGGQPPEQYIGKTPAEMNFSRWWVWFWGKHVRDVFQTGQPVEQEVAYVDWTRKPLIHNLRLVPERDGQGRIRSVLAISRDITKQKQTEQGLLLARETAEKALRAKSEFLSNMSHELRTPLNGIMGMLQLMQTDPLPEEREKFVSLAMKASERLTQVLSDILEFSDLEAGRLELDWREFSIGRTMDDLVALYGPLARQQGLALECWVAPSLPARVEGDQARLRQILVNLTSNALAFTRDGLISLRVEPTGTTEQGQTLILFTIADSGIGIASEDQERVFAPFTQVDGSLTRSHGGIGMGLTMARGLAEMMGGRLELSSRPGRGVTIRMTLPFRPARTSEARHEAYLAMNHPRNARQEEMIQ
jgi:PAS domain S-box-containing protein